MRKIYKHIDFFKNNEKLYHFTKMDSAKSILESKSLRFGRLSAMNDIHERSKMIFNASIDSPDGIFDVYAAEVNMYRQISLTMDRNRRFAFDLHQMWGIYAEKAEGVCLVFDKNNLLSHLLYDDLYQAVEYQNYVDSNTITAVNSFDEIQGDVFKQKNAIFFQKRIEWEHEQEFRILRRCLNPSSEYYLPSFPKYIIISTLLQEQDIVKFQKAIKDLKIFKVPILLYGCGLDGNYVLQSLEGDIIWNSMFSYDVPILGINAKIEC